MPSRERLTRRVFVPVFAATMLLAAASFAAGGGPKLEATQFAVDFEPVSETAKCGPKQRALGGGILPTGDITGTRVLGTGPLDKSGDAASTDDGDVAKQWGAAVRNAGGVSGRTHKVYATCAKSSDATIEAEEIVLNEKEQGSATAQCGRGERAIGGGAMPEGDPAGLPLHSTGPLDASGEVLETSDGDKAKGWYAALVNEGAGIQRVVNVYAICSSDSKGKVKTADFTLDDQTAGEQTVKCGRGQAAISGGVVQDGSAVSIRLQASGPLTATGDVADADDGDTARKWFVSIFNGSGVDGRVFRAFAICE